MKPKFQTILSFFLLAGILNGCATLPEITPLSLNRADRLETACKEVFPDGPRRFVHSVEMTAPGGRKGLMMGVILLHPQDRSIEAAMMTVEGLVVFQGRSNKDGKTEIDRGLRPFDAEEFVQGLMDDIRLIFFEPERGPVATGISEAGKPLCRYHPKPSETVDVIPDPETGLWQVKQYYKGRVKRIVRAFPAPYYKEDDKEDEQEKKAQRFPEKLELETRGIAGYHLKMKLIEAEKIEE